MCIMYIMQLATGNWQLATQPMCNHFLLSSIVFAVTRHSHCLSVNRLFIHNYIIYRLINSTRNYFN